MLNGLLRSLTIAGFVSGMDVVRKTQQQPTTGQSLEPPITILSATRVK